MSYDLHFLIKKLLKNIYLSPYYRWVFVCKNAFLIMEHSIIVFAMMTSTAVVPYPKTQNHSSLNFPIWSNCSGVGNSKSGLSWFDIKGRKWCELYPSSILSNTSEFVSPELSQDITIVNNLNTFRAILIGPKSIGKFVPIPTSLRKLFHIW